VRTVQLLRLHARNFKGLRDLEVDLGGEDLAVYGQNGAGKTTLFDAWLWLLFGKDSLNQSDFEIQTLAASGEPLHNLSHEVEATLLIDGRPLTLRKVYSEQWTRKRGSAAPSFTGHTTDHFIDGVPVQAKEYIQRIAGIADEGAFRLLTNPVHFNEVLTWQKRRAILLEVVGDLTDEEVIASDESLARLPEVLEGRSLEDQRKVIAAKRREINEELTRIPVRIDEATLALPDVSGIVPAALDSDIARVRGDLEAKRSQRAQIASGGAVADAKVRLREIQADIQQIRNQHAEEERARVADLDTVIYEYSSELTELRGVVREHEGDLQLEERKVEDLTRDRQRLLAEHKAISERAFAYEEGATTCPACGQPLPADRLQEAREHAEAEFNRKRAYDLEENVRQGTRVRDDLVRYTTAAGNSRLSVAQARQAVAALESDLETVRQNRAAVEPRPITDRADFVAASAKERDAEAEIARLQADSSAAVAKVDEEVRGLEDTLRTLEASRLKVETHRQGEQRIESLRADETRLAAEFEQLEADLYLTEQFVRAKVALLESKINARFAMARFKLFAEQVNGGLQEVCEVTCGGVPYSSLNHGHRLAVGFDILNVLSEHYGLRAPVFLDNAEALTVPIETDSQLIRLTVSPDKTLRIEHTAERQAV